MADEIELEEKQQCDQKAEKIVSNVVVNLTSLPKIDYKLGSKQKKLRNCVFHPEIFSFPFLDIPHIELSVHLLPPQWRREFSFVKDLVYSDYPKAERNTLPIPDIYLILTSQPAELDLLKISDETAKEKDLLLERFFKFSNLLRKVIVSNQSTVNGLVCRKRSFNKIWSDCCDPCSGQLKWSSNCNSIFPEVAFFEKLRRFNSMFLCGACKVVIHPKWKTRFYPATFFTTAKPEVIYKSLKNLNTVVNNQCQK